MLINDAAVDVTAAEIQAYILLAPLFFRIFVQK